MPCYILYSVKTHLNLKILLFKNRKQQRELEIKEAARRRELRDRKRVAKDSIINRLIPHVLWSRRTALASTAISIVIGICAYYYKTQFISVTSGFS